MLSSDKILVTGGAGFIGTNLIKRLLNDGHKVVSLDNYTTGKKENEQKGCQYFEVDLVQTDNYDFFMDKPDVIFHLAAIARIQPSFEHPTYTFHSNVTATLNVLEWARDKGCPIVYAGSSSSHGNKYANPYTFTKWQGEELIKMYNNIYDTPSAICRFYNVYGPHQLTEGEYCTLIGIFETLYKADKPLTITGDGEQRRDFTHVDDIVDGLIKCGNALLDDIQYTNISGSMISGEEFEFGRGKNYSINEIAKAFILTTPMGNGDYPVEYIDEKPGEMRETLCTDTTAYDLLDWKPTKDVIDFIKETYINEE